jgi:hypothetical protein
MEKFLVLFKPNGIDKFLCTIILDAENLTDAAIIFERQNNGDKIFQITLIS